MKYEKQNNNGTKRIHTGLVRQLSAEGEITDDTMKEKINEDFLLLLISNNGRIETTTISIDNHFENERLSLVELCEGENDNINQITQFLRNSLKPKLPNKTFNYCRELDRAYQSVLVN